MDKKMLKVNQEVNTLLRKGLELAMQYEKKGKNDEATLIIQITSAIAYKRMLTSGLIKTIKEFWMDKKGMA